MKTNIIGLKELRENTENYVSKVERGQSFLVMRKSKPLFRISPIDDSSELWEEVVDFTKIKRGGIKILDLLSRL